MSIVIVSGLSEVFFTDQSRLTDPPAHW